MLLGKTEFDNKGGEVESKHKDYKFLGEEKRVSCNV